MKRRITSLLLAFMLCFLVCGSALADSSINAVAQPKSAPKLTSGISASGSRYIIWAKTRTSYSGNLSASFELYRIVNGNEVFVTSGSNSATGTSVTASKTISLSSGTYKLYAHGSSGTASTNQTSTITI